MGRFFLVVFLSIGVLLNPDVRAWLAPHVQWALDPVYDWSANSRVAELARAVAAERAAGRAIPTDGSLEFLRGRYPAEGALLDPWGTPFYLQRSGYEWRVGSAGPDKSAHTSDDILSPS